jgi:hypothetical protein
MHEERYWLDLLANLNLAPRDAQIYKVLLPVQNSRASL